MTFDWLMEILRTYPGLIPLSVFVVALGEAVVFTSPLMPATVLLLGMGGLHQAAGGAFAPIIAAAAIGTFIGDVASYLIGRTYRDGIGGWWPLRNYPSALPRGVAFVQRWGMPGLVASKFLGPVRWFGPTVCGILLMPFTRFLMITAAASVIWSLILLAPPFYGLQTLR